VALTDDRQVHASIDAEHDIKAQAGAAADVRRTAKRAEGRLSHSICCHSNRRAAEIIAGDDVDRVHPTRAERRFNLQPDSAFAPTNDGQNRTTLDGTE